MSRPSAPQQLASSHRRHFPCFGSPSPDLAVRVVGERMAQTLELGIMGRELLNPQFALGLKRCTVDSYIVAVAGIAAASQRPNSQNAIADRCRRHFRLLLQYFLTRSHAGSELVAPTLPYSYS